MKKEDLIPSLIEDEILPKRGGNYVSQKEKQEAESRLESSLLEKTCDSVLNPYHGGYDDSDCNC